MNINIYIYILYIYIHNIYYNKIHEHNIFIVACLLDGHITGVERCCCRDLSCQTLLLLGLFFEEVWHASCLLLPLKAHITTLWDARLISFGEGSLPRPLLQRFATHAKLSARHPLGLQPPVPQHPHLDPRTYSFYSIMVLYSTRLPPTGT